MRFEVGDYVRVRSNVRDVKSGAFGGYEGVVTKIVNEDKVTVNFMMHSAFGEADGNRTVAAQVLRFDAWSPKHDPTLDADV